ncbi:AraC-type DNA-binding protein [Paenibacillus algorifonticola]|uniref:AraC-type DNA-binding protein n=1 Tax=Paenibacillus algorifonticola TaxID=684063 RepID=A0A1I2G4C6_9BACL|nr:AraC family transcriptional regulator [Paenibacillus algorifonticola]SFF11963.1 AraC-type DNA-binding protein [Paenibacillus algorifonticola]
MERRGIFQGQLMQAEQYPRVVAYYFKEWNGFEMAYHQHSAVEIMYVISGDCTVELLNKSIPMEKGHFIVIDSMVAHRLHVAEGTACRMLNVEFIFSHTGVGLPSLKRLAETDHALAALFAVKHDYLLLYDPSDVYQMLKALVLELDGKRRAEQLLTALQLTQLLVQIGRLAQEASSQSHDAAEFYVGASIAFIQQNYDRDIQVKDIAAAVRLHPGYFHRIFKAGTGCSVMDYVMRFRMEKGRMLLEQTDIPVSDICHYVGVNSSQYFSTLFKKYTNETPLAYRRAVRKEVER